MATANTKRQSYTTAEKLKVIQFAEQHGNCSAQREFDIAESNIRLWRRSKENLEKMPRLQRANHGKKATWPRLEQDVMAWITEKRNNGLAILPTMIRLKAMELLKDPQYNIRAWSVQSFEPLVPTIHEEKRLVTATENHARPTSST